VWHRRHAPDIIAEVTPVMGMGTWDVGIFRETNPAATRAGGRFGLLTDAHQAADAMVWAVYQHTCDPTCGVWTAVERRQPGHRKAERLTGRITRLIDDQQVGTIAGEDGANYTFDSDALLGMTFGSLHVGAPVTFIANPDVGRATAVRAATPPASAKKTP
jgi:hypothetical protein